MMNPMDYGIMKTDIEWYVAVSTLELLNERGNELHLEGDLNRSYLGMVALYAVRNGHSIKKNIEGRTDYKLRVSMSAEFDPDQMSHALENFIRDAIENSRC